MSHKTTHRIAKHDPIDELTQASRTISEVRHLLHEGKVFVATETFTSTKKKEYFDILITTGPDESTCPHVLNLIALCEKKDALLYIYVNPTIGPAPAGPESSFNLNFQSSRQAQTKVVTFPEILDPGTQLAMVPLPEKYAEANTPELNAVLVPNTQFLARVYLPVKMTVRFVFKWYEQQFDLQTTTNQT